MFRCAIPLLSLFCLFIAFASLVDGCGFPTGGGGGGGCCCCGGGRKKRSAVQPHFRAHETPCPQAAWKRILEQAIDEEDANGSVAAIQTALMRQFDSDKFLVLCAVADPTGGAELATANRVHFSSSGDAYCNVIKGQTWCQAVALTQ